MKNLWKKRAVVAMLLASWCIQPALAVERVIVGSGEVVDSISGISNSVHNDGYQGGAVDNQGTVGSVTGEFINNSLGTNSAAQQVRGGAINNAGTMTIDGALFQGNTAVSANPKYSYGGAIYNEDGGNLTVGNGTSFIGNTAAYGGGLYNWATATLTIGDNVKFDGNHATNGSGGAIHARNGFDVGDNFVVQNNTTGSGSYGGGGLYIGIDGNKTPPPIKTDVAIGDGAKFINNKTDIDRAGSRGGAILAETAAGGVTIGKNSSFSGNEAQAGGAIWNQVALTFDDNASFSGNKSHGSYAGVLSGGAIANAGANAKTTFKGTSLFSANEAKAGNGGAIDNAGEMIFKDTSVYVKNKASGSGGAVYNTGTITYEKNAIFGQIVSDADGNITGAIDGNTAGGRGGAISNVGGTVTITGESVFAGNSAGGQGGAISNVNLNNPSSKAEMTIGDGAHFVSNTSGQEGGAISNVNASGVGTVTMTIGDDSVFLNNKSGTQGGAIHNQRASLKIGDKAIFKGNTAVGYGGGAIYSDTDGLASSVIIGNAAAFIENKTETKHGGAIMNFNGGQGATFAIGSDALFQKNSAFLNGGAIANYGGVMTVGNGSAFIGNISGQNGGAIYQDNFGTAGSSITINGGYVDGEGKSIDTIFSGNSATGKGGAIYAAGTVNLDAANGDILFDKNTAGGVANDIYVANGGVLNITGSKNVTSNSGIAGDAQVTVTDEHGVVTVSQAIINNSGNLVLNGDNSQYLGTYNQTAGTTILNDNNFFGGTSNIKGGSLTINGKSELVSGSTVDISTGASMSIAEKANVIISGDVSGSGSIFNNGNLTIATGSDNTAFDGLFQQDKGVVTVEKDAIFFGGTNQINGGKIVINDGGKLASDINIDNIDVEFSVLGKEAVLDNSGLLVDGEHYLTGKLNLSDTEVKLDTDKKITDDILLSGSSELVVTDDKGVPIEGPTSVTVGDGTSDNTLTLSNGIKTSSDLTIKVSDNASLALAPKDSGSGSTIINSAIEGGSGASVIVDGITDSKGNQSGVGNIIINSDNSGFTGKYEQLDGSVTIGEGSIMFAGDNTVKGGDLTLTDGALLISDITVDGTAKSGDLASGSPLIRFNGSVGEVTQDMITNGNFNFANIAESTADNVQINQGGLGLANGTIISNLVDDKLTLSNSATGVRFIEFTNGSGVDGNLVLGDKTGLGYGDGAYIKSGSTVTMENAELIFSNDKSGINYDVEIKGTGSIHKGGSAITNITSALTDAVLDVSADNGRLNFVNGSSTTLKDMDVTKTANVNIFSDKATMGKVDIADSGAVNVFSEASTIGDVTVTGKDASLNIFGNSTVGNVVISEATLGIFGNTNMGDLSLGSTLNMANGFINTLNTGAFTLTDNSEISFDANVRNNTIDTINAGSFDPTNAGASADPYKLIISNINFVQSPIDRNFKIDTNNLVQVGGSSAGADIQLKDGSILANTEMGKYLLTSSGSSGILTGSLVQLNPQMYRGQVATVASYANQLVVNNMLFDHMDILGKQLLAEEKANVYAATNPLFAPYQYSKKDGSLWYKAYGNFETISMTQGLNVRNNAYGSLIGADFPLINLKNGWKMVPTAYIGYNGAHQTFNGVGMYQNGAQVGAMGTAYKGDLITSLLAYGGGYANDMSVGGASDTTGNWFAGVASKTAYNFHLPADFILQPTALVSYNIFGNQNFGSNFGAMSMNTGFLNGVNVAPGVNLIWNKKTFSLYATAQMVFNIMGDVSGKAGNVDLNDVRMRHGYFEYGLGAMKKFKDRFTGYIQFTIRNGGRTGIGFQGGLQWKIGKEAPKK